jgi:hypothetical protein
MKWLLHEKIRRLLIKPLQLLKLAAIYTPDIMQVLIGCYDNITGSGKKSFPQNTAF